AAAGTGSGTATALSRLVPAFGCHCACRGDGTGGRATVDAARTARGAAALPRVRARAGRARKMLQVERVGLEAIRELRPPVAQIRKFDRDLANQLVRAASSLPSSTPSSSPRSRA